MQRTTVIRHWLFLSALLSSLAVGTAIGRAGEPRVRLGRPVANREAGASRGALILWRAQDPDPIQPVSLTRPEFNAVTPAAGKDTPAVSVKKPEPDKKTTGALATSAADSKESPPVVETPPVAGPVLLPYDPLACGPRGPGGGAGWIDAEFLYWRIKGMDTPPLVTTSVNLSDDPPGAIGQPGTIILFGSEKINEGWRPGLRLSGGIWLDLCQSFGLDASVFFLEHRGTAFAAFSNGSPPLFRPFLSVFPFAIPGNPPQQIDAGESVQLVAFPDRLTGAIVVSTHTRFWGAEANVRKNMLYGCTAQCDAYHVDLFAGFRHLQLDEGLAIREGLTVPNDADPVFIPGLHTELLDSFGTHNRFYGGQVGAHGEIRRGRWFIDVKGKLALGCTRQIVQIDGYTALTPPGGPTFLSRGGLYALSTNSGERCRSVFSVVPEIGVNVGYQVNDDLRLFAGYTFLYWSNVVRPGDQIDRGLNLTFLPFSPVSPTGPARPAFLGRDTDFWAHGFNAGFEWRF